MSNEFGLDRLVKMANMGYDNYWAEKRQSIDFNTPIQEEFDNKIKDNTAPPHHSGGTLPNNQPHEQTSSYLPYKNLQEHLMLARQYGEQSLQESLEKSEKDTKESPDFSWGNLARGAGETVNQYVGDAAQAIGNYGARGLNEGFQFLSWLFGDSDKIWAHRIDTGTIEQLDRDTYIKLAEQNKAYALHAAGDDIEKSMSYYANEGTKFLRESDFGYIPQYTWDYLKHTFKEDDYSLYERVSSTLGYMVEQLIVSGPEMVAATLGGPVGISAYLASVNNRIAQERAQNKGKEFGDMEELAETLLPALLSAGTERIATKALGGSFKGAGSTSVGKAIAVGALREGGQEAFQEGVEYAGATVGIEDAQKGFKWSELADRSAAGAVAGAGIGAAFSGAGQAYNNYKNRRSDTSNPPKGLQVSTPGLTGELLGRGELAVNPRDAVKGPNGLDGEIIFEPNNNLLTYEQKRSGWDNDSKEPVSPNPPSTPPLSPNPPSTPPSSTHSERENIFDVLGLSSVLDNALVNAQNKKQFDQQSFKVLASQVQKISEALEPAGWSLESLRSIAEDKGLDKSVEASLYKDDGKVIDIKLTYSHGNPFDLMVSGNNIDVAKKIRLTGDASYADIAQVINKITEQSPVIIDEPNSESVEREGGHKPHNPRPSRTRVEKSPVRKAKPLNRESDTNDNIEQISTDNTENPPMSLADYMRQQREAWAKYADEEVPVVKRDDNSDKDSIVELEDFSESVLRQQGVIDADDYQREGIEAFDETMGNRDSQPEKTTGKASVEEFDSRDKLKELDSLGFEQKAKLKLGDDNVKLVYSFAKRQMVALQESTGRFYTSQEIDALPSPKPSINPSALNQQANNQNTKQQGLVEENVTPTKPKNDSREREEIEVDSLEEQARVLQGEPVAHIEESALDMPKEGGFKAITEWASSLFERQGNATTNAKLGTVQFNEQSVRDSLAHGGFNPYKNMAFAAVSDVIREGSLVAIDSNHKGEDSFYLSAPVLMNGKRNILTTLIHRDVNTQRMYVHSVILQENLLKPRVSEAQEGKTSRKHNSSLTSTDIHNILHQALTYKPLSDKKVVEAENIESNTMLEDKSAQTHQQNLWEAYQALTDKDFDGKKKIQSNNGLTTPLPKLGKGETSSDSYGKFAKKKALWLFENAYRMAQDNHDSGSSRLFKEEYRKLNQTKSSKLSEVNHVSDTPLNLAEGYLFKNNPLIYRDPFFTPDTYPLDSKPITEQSQAPKDEENKSHKTQKEKRDSVSRVGVSESSALNEGKKEQDGPSQNINYSESKRDNESNKPSRHQADEKTEPTTSVTKPPEEDFVIEDSDEVKGLKKQFNTNIKIIELLATLKQEERQATQEERNLLSQWTGWGGLSNAFYRPDGTVAEGWSNEAKQLKDILSDQEYKEALASILDAYYTPKMLIKTIWELLKGMGFEGGIVLEPSMGTGNFIGMAPKNNKTAFLGVELNPMSGAIARHLYPNAGIEITDFKDYLPPNHVDLVVGNPPFGSFKVYDPKIPEISGFSIHNYFMAKSLYSLKPNGVMAMVVSSHFMDSKSDATREYMVKHGEFLGAVRLPNGVFKENANTDVLTDIVFFRKKTQEEIDARDNLESLREDFLETSRYGRHDSGVYINQYFKHHREKVLGELEIKPTSRFGTPILGVKANDDIDLEKAIKEQLADIKDKFTFKSLSQEDIQAIEDFKSELSPKDNRVSQEATQYKVGSIFKFGGNFYTRGEDKYGLASYEPFEVEGKNVNRLNALLDLRAGFQALRDAQLDKSKTNQEVENIRKAFAKQYDEFVKKFNHINTANNIGLMWQDPIWSQLSALETLNPDYNSDKNNNAKGDKYLKADIFTKRTQYPSANYKTPENAKDALLISLEQKGGVDILFMQSIYSKGVDDIIRELGDLVILNPTGSGDSWVLTDNYISGGKFREKLAKARELAERDKRFERNVEALMKVQPPKIEYFDIKANMGSPWIPSDYIKRFIYDKDLGFIDHIAFNSSLGEWRVDWRQISRFADSSYKVDKYSVKDMIDAILNSKSLQVTKKEEYVDGGKVKTKTIVLPEETQELERKMAEIRSLWDDWVYEDPKRREELEEIYNRLFNNTVLPKYDGSHLRLIGSNPDIQLRPTQKNAVWRIVQSPSTLLDHVVGAGKSFTMIASIMELRRLGISNKPMMVLPNHLVSQMHADFLKLYPSANILTVSDTSKYSGADGRKLFASRVATGDWDAILIPQSFFDLIDVSDKARKAYYREQVEELEGLLEKETNQRSLTAKQLQTSIKSLKRKLDSLLNGKKSDSRNIEWEELGVDALFLDEAHLYKNLSYHTRLQKVRGLGSQNGSTRAVRLKLKIEHMTKSFENSRVVFSTGTPISNSITEMYHMIRYLSPESLKDLGIEHFDAWAKVFGNIVRDFELSAVGTYKEVARFSKFNNIPELLKIYGSFTDRVDRKILDESLASEGKVFPVPKLANGKPDNIVAKRSDIQAEMIGLPIRDELGNIIQPERYPPDSLLGRVAAVEGKRSQKGGDNILAILSSARAIALDPRILDPDAPDFEGSKVNKAADNILDLYQKWDSQKGTQLVFLDLSTPIKHAGKEIEGLEKLLEKAESGEEAALEELEALGGESAVKMRLHILKTSNFSVYDDLKAKLIQRGIKASEIAFIHDADTAVKKSKLFADVNNGDVRVLLGSTSRMGAGTNVQKRLVAVHHLDVPWRPADLEQRDGRIIRQGNMFYNNDPENFVVHSFRYATEGTMDAMQWQLIESKARSIDQIRNPEFSGRGLEEDMGESEAAAAMKAAASGNPLIMEEVKLRKLVRDLESERKQFIRNKHRLQDSYNESLRAVERLKKRIVDLKAVQAIGLPDNYSLTLDGKTFNREDEFLSIDDKKIRGRERFGEAILIRLSNGDMKRGITLGEINGFIIEGFASLEAKRAYLELYREEGDGALSIQLDGEQSAVRIMNAIEKAFNTVENEIAQEQERLHNTQRSLQTMQENMVDVWSKEDEFKEAQARHEKVSQELRKVHPSDAKDGDIVEYKANTEPSDINREALDQRASDLFTHARQVLIKGLGEELASKILLVRTNRPHSLGWHHRLTGRTYLVPERFSELKDANGNVVVSRDEFLVLVAWHELLHRSVTVEGKKHYKTIMRDAYRHKGIKFLANEIYKQYHRLGKKISGIKAIEEALAQIASAINTPKGYEFLSAQFGDNKHMKSLFERHAWGKATDLAKRFVVFFKRLMRKIKEALGLNTQESPSLVRGDVIATVRNLLSRSIEDITVTERVFRQSQNGQSKTLHSSIDGVYFDGDDHWFDSAVKTSVNSNLMPILSEVTAQARETANRLGGKKAWENWGKPLGNYKYWIQSQTPAFKKWLGKGVATPEMMKRFNEQQYNPEFIEDMLFSLNIPPAPKQPSSADKVMGTLKRWQDNFFENWVDRQYELERLSQRFSDFVPVRNAFKAYNAKVAHQIEKLLLPKQKELAKAIHHGFEQFKSLPVYRGMSEKEARKMFMHHLDLIGKYVMHGLERNIYIANKTNGKDMAGSGKTDSEIIALTQEFTKSEAGNGALIDYYQHYLYPRFLRPIIDESTQVLQSSGLLTANAKSAMPSWKWYIPLYGKPQLEDDTVDTLIKDHANSFGKKDVIKNTVHQASGRHGTEAHSLFENILSQLENSIRRAEFQLPKQKLWEALQLNKDLRDALEAKLDVYQTNNTTYDSKGERAWKQAVRSADGIIWQNGDTIFAMRIGEPKALSAFKDFNKQVRNWFGVVTRFMASTFTRYNPDFILKNKFMDTFQQWNYLLADAPLGHQSDTYRGALKNIQKRIPLVMKAMKYNVLYTSMGAMKRSDFKHWRERFALQGGITNYSTLLSSNALKDLERMAWEEKHGSGFIPAIAELLDRLNRHAEDTTRVSAFRALVESGVNDETAAHYVKDIMNFETKGIESQKMGNFYAFFTTTMYDIVRKSKMLFGSKEGQVLFGINVAMFYSIHALISALFDDDDFLDKYPMATASRHFIIPLASDDGVHRGEAMRIPVGFGINQMANTVALSLRRLMTGYDDFTDTVDHLVNHVLVGGFSPIQSSSISPSEKTFSWFAQTFSPTFFKPLVQIGMNENYLGAPIYEDEGLRAKGELDYNSGFSYTPDVYKNVSRMVFDSTGADIAPETIQHFFENYGGGIAKTVARMTEKINDHFGDGNLPVTSWWNNLPALSAFTQNIPRDARNKYYSKRKESLAGATYFENALRRRHNTNPYLHDAFKKRVFDEFDNALRKIKKITETARGEMGKEELQAFERKMEKIKNRLYKEALEVIAQIDVREIVNQEKK